MDLYAAFSLLAEFEGSDFWKAKAAAAKAFFLSLSGEKIQWYLASELRDRIRDAKVRVMVIDKLARRVGLLDHLLSSRGYVSASPYP